MNTNTKHISLSAYHTGNPVVFMRGNVDIQQLINDITHALKEYDTVNVNIPQETMSLNPSFLEPIFVAVLKEVNDPEHRLQFTSPVDAKYDPTLDLEEGLDRAIRQHIYTKNP